MDNYLDVFLVVSGAKYFQNWMVFKATHLPKIRQKFLPENRWERKKKVTLATKNLGKMMVEMVCKCLLWWHLTWGWKVIKTCWEFRFAAPGIMRISVKIRYGILNSHALATSSIGSDLNFLSWLPNRLRSFPNKDDAKKNFSTAFQGSFLKI